MKKSLLAFAALLSGCVIQQNPKPTLVELGKGEMPDAPKVISIKMNKYLPETGHQFKELYVSNFSVNVRRGKQEESSSRDGLSDDLKARAAADYGTAAGSPNSANPLFSDLMLFLSGLKTAQQSYLYCPTVLQNSKSDDAIVYLDNRTSPGVVAFLGLRDCEKSYLGLKPDLFDFDQDTIPDYLELRCGLNPRNANDAALSLTGDGVSQLEKCKRHIPIDESADSPSNKLYAYQYEIKTLQDQSKSFRIANIPVSKAEEQNLIVFYLIESDKVTSKTYLYTAYTLLKPKADSSNDYEFDYWVKRGDASTYFNQQVTFP